jgi:hypothetical protein
LKRRLRTSLDGSGPYLWAAFFFSLLGLLLLFAQIQSPDFVIWNGHCTSATEEGGIVYYRVNGQELTIDDVAAPANSPTRTVTICYYPARPEDAMILHPAAYWLEGSLVVVPFIVALAILATGLVIVPFRIQRRRARLRL